MNIVFDGRQIVIQFDGAPPLAELNIVRNLPYRRFDTRINAWLVEFVVENIDALQREGVWPSHLPRSDRRGSIVDATERTLLLRVPQHGDTVAKCGGLPDTKRWSQTDSTWHVKPTRHNVEYIRRMFPDIPWSDAALELLGKTEAPHVESKSKLEQLKAAALADYTFYTQPFEHQLAAFALSRDATAYGLLMEPGTGKTKAVIDNATYLHRRAKLDGLGVVCPKSIKRNWENEVAVHMPPAQDRQVLVWDSGKTKLEQVQELCRWSIETGGLAVFIMNIDALVTTKGIDAMTCFLTSLASMLVVDESTRIKNISAKRTKAAIKLGKLACYKRILTGTPVTQGPLDLFAQFSFLDTNILGYGSYYSFRNAFAVMGGYQGRQIVKYVNLDTLAAMIAPYSFRVTKRECLDLPEKIYQKLPVELTPTQRRIYKDLADNMEAEIEGIGIITATIALTIILRFQQVIGGFMPVITLDEEGTVTSSKTVPIPGGNPKLDTLLDFVEDVPDKAIIWAHFRPEIAIIADALREKYGAESVVEFHGGCDEKARNEAIRKFQGWPNDPHDPSCRFFVGQTETGGIGLTLTRAHDVVYYSNGCSLESRLQSEDRAHRIGQDAHVRYTDLVATRTVDDKLVYPALRKKLNLASVITGDNIRDWL